MRSSSSLLRKNNRFQFWLLFFASCLLLFGMLGAKELWTQEHRWADIVSGMFYRQDFFHPYLENTPYYDKPLLSYWLIALLAWLKGSLSLTILRIPSALAGLLAIVSIYRLGRKIKNEQLGLLAGWILLTTFYFVFWARVSSADMLNLAGSLFAVSWYFDKRDSATFFDFFIFFLILAITSLCKGLGGAVVAFIAILPDLLHGQRFRKYLHVKIFLAAIPAAIIYLSPFLISGYFGSHENGLYLVYRENFVRYFQPFDHEDPIYSYFIYLPLYLLPWTFFFIPALFSLKSRWKSMSFESKWIVWATCLLFLFFTLSGSRRNYYVLPIVPFAVLMTADWMLSSRWTNLFYWVRACAISFFILLFSYFVVIQPLYFFQGGYFEFASRFKEKVTKIKPIRDWNYILINPEQKLCFYLNLSPKNERFRVDNLNQVTSYATLIEKWPQLKKTPTKNIIILSRKEYEPFLTAMLGNDFELMAPQLTLGERLTKDPSLNSPIAYVPKE